MPEKKKAGIYLDYLDRILAGEKDVGTVEDKEIEEILCLAKTMLNAGLGDESKIKEKLKQKIFSELQKDDDELNEEELDNVSAAYTGKAEGQEVFCSYCGSRKIKGKCPHCGL